MGMSRVPTEPKRKRTIAFVDGQNLYHATREAFGYTYPNFDVLALAQAVCKPNGWDLLRVHFYTGVPNAVDDARWNHFWTHKLAAMGRQGVWVFSRPLRYRNQLIHLPDGSQITFLSGEEKGVDVRLALDVIRMAHHEEFDVAIVFSQDQDLLEVAGEMRAIAREQARWIKVVSAFPFSPTTRNKRGIEKTDWVRIDRATYDACLDRRDYRLKGASAGMKASK